MAHRPSAPAHPRRDPVPTATAVAALVATLALLLVPVPATAWDDVGHRVVAAIAWERMSPAAREAAVELLRAAPADSGIAELEPDRASPEERRRELFLAAATWPDLARGTSYHRGGWHYVNHFWRFDDRGRPVPVEELRPAPQNVVERLGALEGSLADRGAPKAQRGLDLAWVLHLVGDVHQPLHTSARVTDRRDERRGDKGGNTFLLHRRGWFDDRRWNLHAYWDNILDLARPRQTFEGDAAFVERMVGEVMGQAAAGDPTALGHGLKPGDYEAWAREGVVLAQDVVYLHGLERLEKPPQQYLDVAHGVAVERMARAGARLADLLERTLGDRRRPLPESGKP